MHDTAVIYYTRTGTTRQAAHALGARLGCPVFEVVDATSRAGLWGDVRCVLDNLLVRKSAYRYSGPALADYEKIVIMAPVWLGHLAAPMRCFLTDHRGFQGGFSAIVVMAARGGFHAAEEIAIAAGRLPHPFLALLQRDIASGEAQQDIDDFAKSLSSKQPAASQPSPRSAWLSPNDA